MPSRKLPSDPRSLAILHDPGANFSPSNQGAISKFCDAARRYGVVPTIIGKGALEELHWFDALLIRDLTHPKNYTFDFSRTAAHLRMPCIDDMPDIIVGCDKNIQALRFNHHKIPTPKTRLFTKHNFADIIYEIGAPCVIKIPDSSYSQGVFLAKTTSEAARIAVDLLDTNEHSIFVIQEFVETDFDWRIGILDNQPLFACKYHMVPGDYRIVAFDESHKLIEGYVEAVKLDKVPLKIISLAERVSMCFGSGLYGIDIKINQEDHPVVIEANDCPNIDTGYEDVAEGDCIYDKIITKLFNHL